MVGSLTRLSIEAKVVSCSRTISPRTLLTHKQHMVNDYSWGSVRKWRKITQFQDGLKSSK